MAETDTRERLSKYPRDKINRTLNLSLKQALQQIKKFEVDLIQSYPHLQMDEANSLYKSDNQKTEVF